ncbi:hypothetical protein PhCBS80983_g02816 [Powellomyces hirtus]|uniref:SH3 domain-containing protein n=1 Tax=Powellomyces hirtus TaxID=109895 RepID=A0A507E795_9FUNG|nr:hypothetical protein PhCBS80983_g02816 [Powellomyces hirtus]
MRSNLLWSVGTLAVTLSGVSAQAPPVAPAPPVAAPSVAAPVAPAQAPAAPAAAGCFSLAGSKVCSPWQVAVNPGVYTNLATFEAYITRQYDNSTTYLKQFQDFYGCPGYPGGQIRYHVSFLCGMILDVSTVVGGCNTVGRKPMPMCLSSGVVATKSLENVLQNLGFCSARKDVPPTMTTYQASLLSDNNCVPAVPEEWSSCGFWKESEVAAFCAPTAATRSDPCCSAYATRLAGGVVNVPNSLNGAIPPGLVGRPSASGTQPATSIPPTPAANGTDPNATASAAGGAEAPAGQTYGTPTTPIIVGACVVALVLIAAVVGAVLYARRRKTTRAPDGFLNASNSLGRDGSLKYKGAMAAGAGAGAGAAYGSGSRGGPSPTYGGYDNRSNDHPEMSMNNGGYGYNNTNNNFGNSSNNNNNMMMNNAPTQPPSPSIATGAAAAAAAMMGVESPKEDVGEPIQIAETMEVLYNYVPNLVDEIYLYIGDPVIVKCKFDDGWGYGFNMTTKQEGSFPLACVAPYNSNRSAEINGATPADASNPTAPNEVGPPVPPLSLTPSPPTPSDESGWKDTLDSRRRVSSLTPIPAHLQQRYQTGTPNTGTTTMQSSPLSGEYSAYTRDDGDDDDEGAHLPSTAAPVPQQPEFDGDDDDKPHLHSARQTYQHPPLPFGSYKSYDTELYTPTDSFPSKRN